MVNAQVGVPEVLHLCEFNEEELPIHRSHCDHLAERAGCKTGGLDAQGQGGHQLGIFNCPHLQSNITSVHSTNMGFTSILNAKGHMRAGPHGIIHVKISWIQTDGYRGGCPVKLILLTI